jgi:hypothetical protein
MLSSSKEEIAMSKSCRWGLLRKYYAHSHAGIPAHDLRDHLIDTATEAERHAKRIGLTGWGTPTEPDLGHGPRFRRRFLGQ